MRLSAKTEVMERTAPILYFLSYALGIHSADAKRRQQFNTAVQIDVERHFGTSGRDRPFQMDARLSRIFLFFIYPEFRCGNEKFVRSYAFEQRSVLLAPLVVGENDVRKMQTWSIPEQV